MKTSVLELLRCPVCQSDLFTTENGKSCLCRGERTHCFDFSKSGYLNLAGPQGGDGDKKEAILARRTFLSAGYYQPLSDALCKKITELKVKSVLDAGCGEGYYTNRIDGEVSVLGIDLSRGGIDAAAKAAKSLSNGNGFAIASLFSMPVKDACLDLVLNIFAPCAEEEFSRVLRPGGYVLLVGAGERHLFGLKSAIYENPYLNQGRADLPQSMQLLSKERLHYTVTVNGQEHIQALFSMTPYYWRTSESDREKLLDLDALTTELDFDIFLFRKDI